MAEATGAHGWWNPDTVFDVVFLCTGNRARSPLAEMLFRRYSEGVDVRVRSFGTLERDDLPALREAVASGRNLMVDLSRHRSRSLRGVDLSSADLVLGFEPFHVTEAIRQVGARRECTFLLAELVALLQTEGPDGDPAARARVLVERADSRRVGSDWTSGVVIDDPVGKPAEVMRAISLEIDRLVRVLVERLFARSDG